MFEHSFLTVSSTVLTQIKSFLDEDGLRVMGGSKTTSTSAWPFVGSLNAECGAVLIGKHYALTAAHCCVDGDLKVKTAYEVCLNAQQSDFEM